jgi:hypothetical protein
MSNRCLLVSAIDRRWHSVVVCPAITTITVSVSADKSITCWLVKHRDIFLELIVFQIFTQFVRKLFKWVFFFFNICLVLGKLYAPDITLLTYDMIFPMLLLWKKLGVVSQLLPFINMTYFMVWIRKSCDWAKLCCSFRRKEAMPALMSYMIL